MGRRPHVALRVLLIVALAGVATLSSPFAANAHAEIVLASPAPGVGLPQAPGAVVIKFSEPLNLELSRIDILDLAGTDVGEGPTLPVEGDAQAMQRKLGLVPVGVYTVRWITVSRLDGHVLRGSYRFGVGSPARPDAVVRNSPLDSEGPLGLLGRYVALIGLSLWSGLMLLLRVARATVAPGRLGVLARVAPGMAFVGTLLSLVSVAFVASGTVTALGGLVASPSGLFRGVVVLSAGLGLLVGPRLPIIGLALAGIAIVAEAASGHAAASVAPVIAVPSFALHLVAGGVWIFAIVASLLARDLRGALTSFTPYVIAAAAATGLTGLANAVLTLSAASDLLETGYGLGVLWKSGLFALMVALGFLHFRWRRKGATEPVLRLPVRAETIAAFAAVAVATLLVGFPNPPREAEAAETLTGIDPVLSELDERKALSVAGVSGPFIVGLTLLPPEPGSLEVRLQVVGVEAADGLRDARFVASSGATSAKATLEACGLGCFAGAATLDNAGDWRLEVTVASNRGPITVSTVVPLPAPDGRVEFERALAAMEGLRSAALDERLSGSEKGRVLEAAYRFEAPDRMEIAIAGTRRIIIGERQFTEQASGEWTEASFPGFSWPTDYYRSFWDRAAAVHILGTENVDGVPSRVVAFVRADIPAWFRLWVGTEDGLVRRQEMRAQGHIMDHAYSAFNEPMGIEPPR